MEPSNTMNIRNEEYMPVTRTTKRNWILVLFGLPFFCIGAGFLIFWIVPTLHDGWRMAFWPETQATLLSAKLNSSYSGKSTTYSVAAQYRYVIEGRSYRNDRVAIGSGADNIGEFQQKLGRELEQALQAGQPISVWYDPENPADAVLSRDIRWGLLGFALIFVIAFGGVGGGCIYFGLRRASVEDAAATGVQPWLQRSEWRTGVIQSGAKGGMYFVWGFAAIWNLVSMPFAFFVPELWRDEGGVALLLLIFPSIGVLLIYWAVKITLEWKRFGATPLSMDPFPGAIGGDVGGKIKVDVPYDPKMAFELTLSCINSYASGSGKSRSRHENLIWQDSGYAVVQPAMRGICLKFRFEVPEGVPASEPYGDNYHFWRLNVHGEMAGVDMDRNFEIPVYGTAAKSQQISMLSARERPVGIPGLNAEALLPLAISEGGVTLHYTMLRDWGAALGMLMFGGIFAGIEGFLWHLGMSEGFGPYTMGGIFLLIGGSIMLAGLYAMFNALHVHFDGRSVSSVRTVLGVPVSRKSADYRSITAIQCEHEGAAQSGKAPVIDYRVVAKTAAGDIVLAESLDSHSKAKTVVEYFEKLIGVKHDQ
ncbi:MAG: DUF3592 domain-containing protein [Gammaproteobacteria bacterium]